MRGTHHMHMRCMCLLSTPCLIFACAALTVQQPRSVELLMTVRMMSAYLVNSNGWYQDGSAGLAKTWIYLTMPACSRPIALAHVGHTNMPARSHVCLTTIIKLYGLAPCARCADQRLESIFSPKLKTHARRRMLHTRERFQGQRPADVHRGRELELCHCSSQGRPLLASVCQACSGARSAWLLHATPI